MKFLTLIFALWSTFALAQETLDVSFLQTQRTSGSPFAIPISVNAKGEISLFGQNGTDNLSFQPTLQVGYSRVVINYSQPIILNRFNFFEVQKDLGWIEVKRQRIEAGMGLSSIIKSATTVGLIPYKGAMQTVIRYKKSSIEKSLPVFMPKKFEELKIWNEGDTGTYQSYGGITAYAGFSAGIVDIATLSFGLQNQFIIEIKKIAEDKIILKIGEEDLNRRQAVVGPFVANGTFAQFKGKRFTSEFELDLDDPGHAELYHEGIKGNLQVLQERLPEKNQKLTWEGHDRHYYVGIPWVIGKTFDKGHYDLKEDGVETELDIIGRRNKGILTPLRNHQDYVYQTEESIVLVWSSEMNKTDEAAFEKAFMSKGRIIGVKGFDRSPPEDTKFGSVVSQIGIHISRKEAEGARKIDFDEMSYHLQMKCEFERLSCRKEKNLKKLMQKFKDLLVMEWKQMRSEMGLLLIKNPALIHAVVKTLKYKKEVYFKFLSERYQSLEGSSAIEI
jgi:hypothetical protein